jgi:hypothetical protein
MTEFVHKEAFNLLCLDLIGGGSARQVYTSPIRPDCVVKVESGAKSFQNVAEWQVWQEVKDTPMAKWFAPCVEISPSGSVLLMKRTEPAPASMYPRRVPAFFTDLKRENWGMYEGRMVCCDYGVSNLVSCGMTAGTIAAKWWALDVYGFVPDGVK